jgi:hypothetical protein
VSHVPIPVGLGIRPPCRRSSRSTPPSRHGSARAGWRDPGVKSLAAETTLQSDGGHFIGDYAGLAGDDSGFVALFPITIGDNLENRTDIVAVRAQPPRPEHTSRR